MSANDDSVSTNRAEWASVRQPSLKRRGKTAAIGDCPRSETRSGISTVDRALLQLLRLTSLTSSTCGFRDILHAVMSGFIYTLGASMFVYSCARGGVDYLTMGVSVVHVASTSGFFGIMFVPHWMALTWSIVKGRRKHGTLMATIAHLLEHVNLLEGSRMSSRSLQRSSRLLAASVLVLLVSTGAIPIYVVARMAMCSTPTYDCLLSWIYVVLTWLFFFCVYLLPIKFVLAAVQLTSGFWAINLELGAALRRHRRPDHLLVNSLRALHDDLSHAFTRLTCISSTEMTILLLSGITQLICLMMMLVTGWQTGTLSYNGPFVAMHISGAAITVLLPCEVAQMTLDAVRETRNLLLRHEWEPPRLLRKQPQNDSREPAKVLHEGVPQQICHGIHHDFYQEFRQEPSEEFPVKIEQQALPDLSEESRQELRHELVLFRETVGRDLDTLGDLGMIRLQSSIVPSILATILTYVIILIQFFLTELTTKN